MKKGEENRRERKKKNQMKTFYHKNMFKNTLNFKINLFVKLHDIFEKNSCPNCLAYIFFDHLKIFNHWHLIYSDIFATRIAGKQNRTGKQNLWT